jgi:8-oxo-dGTP pyrophosphatase MutT (NUDIX family)
MHTPPPTILDPRLTRVLQAIKDLDDYLPPPTPAGEDRAHAAVSLILRSGPELEILLIRRAEAEGDPWSGHMALPGGRRDPEDESLLHTAVRETLEETGVRLSETAAPLGRLDPLVPATRRLPPISIFPFVFGVPDGTGARAASPEVDEVLWTPLSYLRSPQASGTVDIPLGDGTRTFPCLRVEERVIWGLTYRILLDFFRKIEAEPPLSPEQSRPSLTR